MFKRDKVSGQKYLDQMGEYVELHQKDAFTKLIFGTAIILLVLGYFSISKNMKMTMEIPPVLSKTGEITIGYDSANTLFYEVWGSYFVKEYTSLEPHNASKKLDHLLSMTQSDKAVIYKEPLEKKSAYVKSNNIFQSYTSNTESVLPEPQDGLFIFHSEGLLVEKINRVEIKSHCEYNVGLKVIDYKLLVGLMNEKCEKIGSIK